MSRLKNPTLRNRTEELYTCYQCGKCGRVFEDGYLIDDGGTTIGEEEQE